jgi:hypothetical protein
LGWGGARNPRSASVAGVASVARAVEKGAVQ